MDAAQREIELLAHCASLGNPVAILTRLRWDAARYDPAPERKLDVNGRLRQQGARQPTPAQRLADPGTVWQTLMGRGWGGMRRTIAVATDAAISGGCGRS